MMTLYTIDALSLSTVTGGQKAGDNVVDDCISQGITDGFAKQKDYPNASRRQLQKVFSAYQKASTDACETLKAAGIRRPGTF